MGMQPEILKRPVLNHNRAATELVQARRRLEAAGESIRLALEIFERLAEQDGAATPSLGALRRVLWQIGDAGDALRSATKRR